MVNEVPPTVSLDGAAVRRIREEKKLTQLYVAKVVGVTTDTISRWENNRYPSVRRDNAVKLAEALEVSVEDILETVSDEKGVAEAEDRPSEGGTLRKHPFNWFPVFAVVVLILIGGGVWYAQGDVENAWSISAQRVLPSYAAPGNVYPVRVRLDVKGERKGFILREHFPSGWKLTEASPPASSLDNEEGTVRWMIKPGESLTVISYLVRVPPEAPVGAVRSFQGEIVAGANGHRDSSKVDGDRFARVSRHLWADLNGDEIVDDGEMLEASDTFDEMQGVHLDWKRLEQIWDAGSYQWDPDKQRFVAVKDSRS